MPMSYTWYPGSSSSIAGLDAGPQNGSLPHSPAALTASTESPGTGSHHAPTGGFPSTSPYPALTATTSQPSSDSHSQSPHGLPPPNPSSFLQSFGENSLQQHLYAASNRFGPFSSEGGSSAEANFSSPFGMSPQMLSQTYPMRHQAYAGMAGYGDSSQQDMARLGAYAANPYSTAGLDNYYNPFDARSMPGAGQPSESMYSAADRMIKAESFENGMPRPSANPWAQFSPDGREGLYLQSGYPPHPMAPYAGALGPMFHPNSRFHPMGYDGMPFKPDMAGPYGLASPAQQMMYGMDRKSPKKKDMSPVPRSIPTNDSPPVPNKASRYFSQRGIFVFHPPDSGSGMGPYSSMMLSVADRYILCQKMLCQRLSDVDLPPKVTYVYNPLEYAFDTHYKFVKKYYNSCKRILFLGMNPGPFGMSQNGVSVSVQFCSRILYCLVEEILLWHQ